jgi:hypothetical protein
MASASALLGCAPRRSGPSPEALPVGQRFVWQARAEHTHAMWLLVGDSLDVVLLRDRCGVPVGHGMTGCYDASTVRVEADWQLSPSTVARARPLPEGRWRFGRGSAGARLYGKRAGTAELRVSVSGAHVATSVVTVFEAPGAVAVRLEPRHESVAPGDTVRIRLTARDADDRVVAILPLPGDWPVISDADSAGFALVAVRPSSGGGQYVAQVGRFADTLRISAAGFH